MRNPAVKHGGIVTSPDGKRWCVVGVDDDKVVRAYPFSSTRYN